ncbi:Cation/H+ exchanger, partial [Penicillium macrosclerotiorum]|uniref:Cation/H+ exchanger n=1 Tax=Penicillium macrosclerotiorum TaxID=303699 RepID=UPI0025495C10
DGTLAKHVCFKHVPSTTELIYLVPSFIFGAILGPFCINLIDASRWSNSSDGEAVGGIAYALTRMVIGIQMVKVGYELPKRYLRRRAMAGNISMYQADDTSSILSCIIGSCVICIDPVLSQAIAKGPFADKYVRRHLREFISAEAGGNDGFGFPFLMLSIALLRYDDTPKSATGHVKRDWIGATDAGRFGGDVGRALAHWAVEGVLYMIIMGAGYGLLVGFVGRKGLNLASNKRWIDKESFFLFPVAIGVGVLFFLTFGDTLLTTCFQLFVVGTCGCFGTDETLACFIAGCALNWDGRYHSEAEARHDSFNSSIETVLNFGTFVFLGVVMPWDQLHMPHITGITIARLIALGVLIVLFRRIPAIMLGYRFIPKICGDWKEALFMGYFGPIGVGAVSYVEYARRLLPDPGESDAEINHLTAAMIPVVYWLVFFSIIVHGLSIPVLNSIYEWLRVPAIRDNPVEILLLSENEPVPNNSVVDRQTHSVTVNNRFSCVSHHTNGSTVSCSVPEEPSAMMLRSSGQNHYSASLARTSTKGSTCQAEQTAAREVV